MIVATFLGNILSLAEIILNGFGWQLQKKEKEKRNREIDIVENVDKQKKYWYRKCQEDFW